MKLLEKFLIKNKFKKIRHQHYFKDHPQGTLMIDDFYYESPLGLLGKIADFLFLKKYLTTLLEKRNSTIKRFAESNQWKGLLKENSDHDRHPPA
jgi:ligand-binding SRPBCC domain-containing protein